jgi:hypothetical protein
MSAVELQMPTDCETREQASSGFGVVPSATASLDITHHRYGAE